MKMSTLIKLFLRKDTYFLSCLEKRNILLNREKKMKTRSALKEKIIKKIERLPDGKLR